MSAAGLAVSSTKGLDQDGWRLELAQSFGFDMGWQFDLLIYMRSHRHVTSSYQEERTDSVSCKQASSERGI